MEDDDSDYNPYDFAAQFRQLQNERRNELLLAKNSNVQPSDKNKQIIPTNSTSSNAAEAVSSTKISRNKRSIDCIASTSKPTTHQTQKRQKRKRPDTNPTVIGEVICIGDFDDGYNMPPPLPAKKTTKNDELDVITVKQREIEVGPFPEIINRVMNVKVFWRKTRTYRFPLRMFQPIESIFEHFAKLEDIEVTEVTLQLRNKYLQPTDTPHAMDYKIIDFIDGDMEFYRSRYLDPPKIFLCDENSEEYVKYRITQKDIRYPVFMSIKKTDQMVILYLKLSEKLGLDVDSFTLEFDGDKIKYSDTMESLDLDGDECFELFKKNV